MIRFYSLLGVAFLLAVQVYPVFAEEQISKENSEPAISVLEAVRKTLELNPSILFDEQSVRQQRGVLQENKGTFDLSTDLTVAFDEDTEPLNSTEEAAAGRDSLRTQTSGYFAGLSKTFRAGQQASLGVSAQRTEDAISNPTKPNEGELAFTLVQPLFRGRGYDAVGAFEQQAQHLLDSQYFSLQRSVASNVLSTILAYWAYKAAEENVEILKDSENRARERDSDMQSLVKADEQPATILTQSEADLASREAQRIAAEADLFRARQALGIAMGIPFSEINSLPAGENEFPGAKEKVNIVLSDELLDSVMANRTDFKAAAKRVDAAKALLKGAENGTLPQIDLEFKAGYKALSEGGSGNDYFKALEDNAEGVNVRVALNYSFPVQNNTAAGQLLQARSALNQSKIVYRDLRRRIISDLSIAISDLLRSADALQSARVAADSFEKSLKNEVRRFQLGVSTLLDIQQVEDQLTSALLQEVSAEQNFANSIARVHFQAETLVDFGGASPTISLNKITSVPNFNSSQ